MRFLWAVLAFVLAAVSFTAGIAQRTVFLGPAEEQRVVQVNEDAAYLVIDAETLALMPGSQTLRIDGEGQVFVAYGRTADVDGWLADQTYARVVADNEGQLATSLVEPVTEATDGTEGRFPAGSDLWIQEQTSEGEVVRQDQLPDGISMLVASDGTAPAPSAISVTWPLEQKTPWFGPLITLGVIFLLIGMTLYILAIRQTRRRRGPLRKQRPIVEEPRDDDVARGVVSRSERRKALGGKARAVVAIPLAGVVAIVAVGCSPDAWPEFGASPTPTPTPTDGVVSQEETPAPSLTDGQAARILQQIAETGAEADEMLDLDLLGSRVEGKPFIAREANYRIRAEVEDQQPLTAIPSEPIRVMLPQATDSWPRSTMLIVEDETDSTVPPTVMVITQEDAWSPYKVESIAQMQASAEVPDLAPSWLGTAMVPPDSPFLTLPPEDLAAAYADVLEFADGSEYAELFDLESDAFFPALSQKRQETMDALNETGADTAELLFEQRASGEAPISLATLKSGAIVSVSLDEAEVVRPTEEAADIRLPERPDLVALAGEEESATGFRSTYGDQLFFFIPAQGSDEAIRLLAYSSALENVEVLPEEEAAPDDEATPEEESATDEG